MSKKRVVSIMLVLIMMLNLVFAVDMSAKAAERYGTFAINDSSVQTMLYSNTKEPQWDYATIAPNKGATVIITPKHDGRMYVEVDISGGEEEIGLTLRDTKGYENGFLKEELMLPGQSGILSIDVKGGKEYYFGISAHESSMVTQKVKFRVKVYTTLEERKLVTGTSRWTTASGAVESDGELNYTTTYFRLKAEKTGKLSVGLTTSGDITLYNSKFERISDTLKYGTETSKAYFGVKKGKTYYIKVTNCCEDSSYLSYGIRCSIGSATDRDLGAKSDAKTLTRKGSTVSSLFIASGASTDWYKFKVTSKRETEIKINVTGMKSGFLTATLYKGSTNKGSVQITPEDGAVVLTFVDSKGKVVKADAGTYYVKIKRSKYASGLYKIRYAK